MRIQRKYTPQRAFDQAQMFGPDNVDLGTAWCQSAMRRDPNHKIAFAIYREIKEKADAKTGNLPTG